MNKLNLNLRDRYFYALTDQELCKKALKEVAQGFYLLAGLAIIISLFPIEQLKGMWLDGLIYLILALFLHFKQSRVAAVFLVLLAGWACVSSVLNRIGVTHDGGTNIFLAIIMFVYAIRGAQASFCFHKLKGGCV